MAQESIFNFKSYKRYLSAISESKGRRMGVKTELAAAMGSHPAYLSRILANQADLSLEQAERISRFFKFDYEETKFFILLVEEERAGTKELRSFIKQQQKEILQRRMVVQNRIPSSEEISSEDKAVYYSAWYYSAIHILVSIPKFDSISKIANYLELSEKLVQDALKFLEQISLIKKETNGWSVTGRHIHIDRNTKLFRQNHQNWHLRALQSLDQEASEKEVRYAGVFSLSEEDAILLKEELLKNLGEFLKKVSASREETAYVYSFDFFPLGNADS